MIFKKTSPNYSPSSYAKIGHQIHKTLGTNSLNWLLSPKSNASAHFLIRRNGDVYYLVDIKDRSWSAGRIYKPSKRAKTIMFKNWGIYVKPGFYLIQWEFECLANQTYNEEQYNAFFEVCKKYKLPAVIDMFFLTHQDTASYKPNLEVERAEILRRAKLPAEPLKSGHLSEKSGHLKKRTNKIIKLEIKKLLDEL